MRQGPSVTGLGGPFADLVGVELVEITPDLVVGVLQPEVKHSSSFGPVHGGVYCAMVETLASLGASADASRLPTVLGIHTHYFLRRPPAGSLRASAAPLHRGSRFQVWEVPIHDEGGRLLAKGTCRLFMSDVEPAPAKARLDRSRSADVSQAPSVGREVITRFSPFDDLIGLEVGDVTPDRATAVLRVGDRHRHHWQPIAPGVYCTLVETLATLGAVATVIPESRYPLGMENHTRLLSMVQPTCLRVVATPHQRNRAWHLWEVTVSDQSDRLVAEGTCVLAVTDVGSGEG